MAGPLIEETGILYAEVDARRARASRQEFDPVGHYARSDVLQLQVDHRPRPVELEPPATGDEAGPARPSDKRAEATDPRAP